MKLIKISQIQHKIIFTYVLSFVMGVVAFYTYAAPLSQLGLNDSDVKGLSQTAKQAFVGTFYQQEFFSAHSMTLNLIALLLFTIMATNVAFGSLLTEAQVQNYSWMILTRVNSWKSRFSLIGLHFLDAFVTFLLINFGMMIGILLRGGNWAIYPYSIKSNFTGYFFNTYFANILLVTLLSSLGFALLSVFVSQFFATFSKKSSWFRVAGPVIILLYMLLVTIIFSIFAKNNTSGIPQMLIQIFSPMSLLSPGYDGGPLYQFYITFGIFTALSLFMIVWNKKHEG